MQVAVGRLQLSLTVATRPMSPAEPCAVSEETDESSLALSHDVEKAARRMDRDRWADTNYLRTIWRS